MALAEAVFIECRALGHEWIHANRYWNSDDKTMAVVSTCRGCTTERIKRISNNGVQSVKYNYPFGYLHTNKRGDEPTPPIKAMEWRQRFVIHTLKDQKSN